MSDEQTTTPTHPEYTQLTQAHVPLNQAAEVFARRGADGRIPLVVVPSQLSRIRNELVMFALVVLVGGIAVGILYNSAPFIVLGIVLSIPLLVLGVYRSFYVRIPEGVNGLLARGGRYWRTIGSGTSVIAPWIVVTHLVSRREIPFDVPVVEAPTQDDVRANVDALLTFSITDPYQFIYNISADDFDQVLQAACQDAMRARIRQLSWEQIVDLKSQDVTALQQTLNSEVEQYGVTISKINVTYAQPPAEFMRLREARQLVALQRAEQEEKQALAQRCQSDAEALELQKAEAHQRVVELETATEDLRFARLEERLRQYPLAAQYESEAARLAVAQALAGNTRAVLQVGHAGDIAQAFMVRDALDAPDDGPGKKG